MECNGGLQGMSGCRRHGYGTGAYAAERMKRSEALHYQATVGMHSATAGGRHAWGVNFTTQRLKPGF